jgi:hypothetical protein
MPLSGVKRRCGLNTPAHLIFGAAAFARAGQPRVTAAALAGSLLPDISLYVMVAWSRWVGGIPARVIFDQMYFSDAWQAVFAVDNSFVLWGLLLGLALWRGSPVLTAFAGAGLLHLAFDFGLHNEDARRMFWPLSDWVFRSPFSYWDRHHYGQMIGPVEIAACLALSVVLWRRFRSLAGRAMIAAAMLAEAAPGIIFALMFRG